MTPLWFDWPPLSRLDRKLDRILSKQEDIDAAVGELQTALDDIATDIKALMANGQEVDTTALMAIADRARALSQEWPVVAPPVEPPAVEPPVDEGFKGAHKK